VIGPLALPTQLTLYVNFPCNLRCKHCFLYGVSGYVGEYMAPSAVESMSWDVFHAAVDPILAAGGPLSVCMMGGEPLLHRDLDGFVRHLKATSSVYVDVNTNAAVAPRRIMGIVDAGIDAVCVSLDGGSAEVNDAGRGRGSFRHAMRGIEHLLEWRRDRHPRLRVSLNFTITNLNYRDLRSTAELCGRLGLDELYLNLPTFVREGEGEAAKAALARLGIDFRSWQGFRIDSVVDGIDHDELKRQFEELAARSWPFDLYVQPVGYSSAELPLWFTPRWGRVMRQRQCKVQNFRTTVLPSGDVVPCTVYPDVVVGNLHEESIADVWRGERYARFREMVNRRLLPTCTRCCDLYDEAADDPAAFVSDSRRIHMYAPRSHA